MSERFRGVSSPRGFVGTSEWVVRREAEEEKRKRKRRRREREKEMEKEGWEHKGMGVWNGSSDILAVDRAIPAMSVLV